MAAAAPLELDLNPAPKTCAALLAIMPIAATADLHVVVIEGLAGEPRYAEEFDEQIGAIERASASVTGADNIHVLRGDDVSRDAVLEFFAALGKELAEEDPLVVYLVGHGSYDDYEYKFNIAGPDLTDADIAEMLGALPVAKQLLVNTSSASGALAEPLGRDDRMLILATRSGAERHATRFGTYFAAALSDPGADTDKNQRISANEAFRYAERRVSDYFETNDQLSTEHPRIVGNETERMALARLGVAPRERSDSELDGLVAERDALNAEIDALRLSRDALAADAYRAALLEKMLELARIEDAIEAREQELDRAD